MENKPLTTGLLAPFTPSLIGVTIYRLPVPLEFLIYTRLTRAIVMV
jgi:hypothetical protein